MKKLFLGVALLLCFSFAARPTMEIGAFETLVGWKHYTPGGQLESIMGVNCLMGFTYKRYFGRLQAQAINPYWMLGTVFVVVPMANIGLDYVIDQNWTVGGALGILPNLHVSYSF
ncbi:hypothetical protein NO2_1215 [Candidatus Termititenax persephonae]|uniref:Uncharacterized protein n=1 Tax=Candidatus Termititenax persephonae TaxID=2218525 RepID=A0A388TIG8_9BACT|nr:hypothetical protein NO2_1215 [Candidatus Termititenax persephonae]